MGVTHDFYFPGDNVLNRPDFLLYTCSLHGRKRNDFEVFFKVSTPDTLTPTGETTKTV